MPYMSVHRVGLVLEILENALQSCKIGRYFGVLCLWGILDRVGLLEREMPVQNAYTTAMG